MTISYSQPTGEEADRGETSNSTYYLTQKALGDQVPISEQLTITLAYALWVFLFWWFCCFLCVMLAVLELASWPLPPECWHFFKKGSVRQIQPGLHSGSQVSYSYTVKPCFKPLPKSLKNFKNII